MKEIILLVLFTTFIFLTACSISNEIVEVPYKRNTSNAEIEKPRTNKNLVLVELFTSEG